MAQLNAATPLVMLFLNLCRRYIMVDTSPIRSYSMYKVFKTETEFHQERIWLASAVVFQNRFNIEDTVRYIGGPHIGAHRDLPAIRQRLQADVEPELLDQVIHQYEYGAPQQVHGYSSNENFLQYRTYGNHSSCDIYKKKFKQVMLKDSRRGNTLLLDKKLLIFIPQLNLTPQGLVDVDNK